MEGVEDELDDVEDYEEEDVFRNNQYDDDDIEFVN